MATTKKTAAKKKPKKLVVLRLPSRHKGKIDPKEIRRAVITVYNRMREEEAAAKAKARAEKAGANANGEAHPAEEE